MRMGRSGEHGGAVAELMPEHIEVAATVDARLSSKTAEPVRR
jgi:hypothetical protein